MGLDRTPTEKEFIVRTLDLLYVLKDMMTDQKAVPLKLVLSYNQVVTCLHALGYTTEKSFADPESEVKKH